MVGEGNEPIALVALETVEISGTLTVAANHRDAQAGGAPGNGLLANVQGGGAGGGKAGDSGGGGAFCGKGGAGAGMNAGGAGAPFGGPTLVPLLGGSAGGSGLSGSGGGALAIVAGSKISISTTAHRQRRGRRGGGRPASETSPRRFGDHPVPLPSPGCRGRPAGRMRRTPSVC